MMKDRICSCIAGAALLGGVMLLAGCGKEDRAACEIVSFSVNGEAWVIDGAEIAFTYPTETREGPLAPVIGLSRGATVEPPGGAEQDFFATRGVNYTVTARDGVTTKVYNVRATVQPLDSGTTGDCAWAITGVPGNYVLAIGGEGGTGNYPDGSGEGAPWWLYRDEITSAVVREGVTAIGDGVLFDYGGLTAVTIPGSVTAIGKWAFSECVGLMTVVVPNSVLTIGEGAFSGCGGLTSVVVGNSVTAIGAYAFFACSSLTRVTIPRSVTVIRGSAFCDCSGLNEVINLNPVPQDIAGRWVFLGVDTGTCTLRVPAGSVEDYKAAAGWKEFRNIVAVD